MITQADLLLGPKGRPGGPNQSGGDGPRGRGAKALGMRAGRVTARERERPHLPRKHTHTPVTATQLPKRS